MEDSVNFTVDAVLPAGGVGQRMRLEKPKQFLEVCGKPLICYTLEAFECISWIRKIAVPVAAEWKSFLEDLIKEYDFTKTVTAEGKSTRHRSIYEGVKMLRNGNETAEVVIIHDAVRPLVDEDILRKVAIAAKEYGASGAVRSLISTVCVKDNDCFMDYSLDRSKCRSSEMPQAFRYSVISEAYSKTTYEEFEFGTECLQLARTYTGVKAKLIDGPESLWKITHPQDIQMFERIIKDRRKCNILIYKAESNRDALYENIIKNLKSDHLKVTEIHQHNCQLDAEGNNLQTLFNEKFKQHSGSNLDMKLVVIYVDDLNVNWPSLPYNDGFLNSVLSLVIFSKNHPIANKICESIRHGKEDNSSVKLSCGVMYRLDENDKNKVTCISTKINELINSLVTKDVRFIDGQIFQF